MAALLTAITAYLKPYLRANNGWGSHAEEAVLLGDARPHRRPRRKGLDAQCEPRASGGWQSRERGGGIHLSRLATRDGPGLGVATGHGLNDFFTILLDFLFFSSKL